ncbi:MAG: iron complex outermembrane receptor protein [Moritella sp.]|jgi:iron complex outermembrane receptor protein
MELTMKLAKSKKTKFVLNPIMIVMLGLSSHANALESLDTTVVTANRSTQSISDIAATVLVIEEAQIAEQAKSGVDFKALLANLIPSLDMGSQTRTNAGQNMRGRKTLVMIDGISLNSSRGVSRQFDSINPFNIARIEVISGASAMYGGGSTGGIINIITKKGRDALGSGETWLGAKSGFNSGEDLEYQVAQAVSMNNESMDARLAVSYNKSGAMYDSNGDMVLQDATQTTSQFNSQLDLLGNVGFNLSSTKRFELMAQYYDSGQDSDYGVDYGPGLGYLYDDGKQIEMKEGYVSDQQAESVRGLITLNYSDSDFYNQTLNLQLFYRNEALRYNPFPDPKTKSMGASQQDTQVFGTKIVFTAEPTNKMNLVYGIDADLESFESSQSLYDFNTSAASGGLINNKTGEIGRYPEIKNTSYAAFLQGDYAVSPSLILNAGMRYQYTNVDVKTFVPAKQQIMISKGAYSSAEAVEGGDKGYANTLVNAGSLYKISKEQQVWLNFSQGFEIPDPAKYYGQGQYSDYNTATPKNDGLGNTLIKAVSVAGSPLDGVKTNALELGWRLNSNNVSTQFVAYYSKSDKQVQYDKTEQTINVVDKDERNYGLEGQLDYFVTSEVSIGSNFNYIINEVKVDGKWKEKGISYASPSKASAYVAWQSDLLQARLQTMQMFSYEDDNDDKLNGYNTVDLLTGVRLPVGSLQFGITNLLNTEYNTLWSQRSEEIYSALVPNTSLVRFEGQGRTYSVNYSFDF